MPAQLPRASLSETAAVLGRAAGPLFAKGVILRRPLVVRALHATGAEMGEVERGMLLAVLERAWLGTCA